MTTLEIPASIMELARKVQAQDNAWHITSHPQYEVRTKERVYAVELQDEDGSIWIDKRACEPASQPTANLMEARYRKDFTTETENFRRCPYKEIDVTVQVFFSEENARAWMVRQKHNYSGLFLYVESGVRNYEWQAIREFLLTLPSA